MARRGPRGGGGSRQSPLNPSGGGGNVGGVFDRFINALDRVTQNLVSGLPGQSTNSQVASNQLNTRINLASAAFVAQRVGSALGPTAGEAGQALGAAAFGFNAAGPAGALAAGATEVFGIARRNAEQQQALLGQKALNQNQVGGDPVQRAQERVRIDYELGEQERKGTFRGFVEDLGTYSPAARFFGLTGENDRLARMREAQEAAAAAERDPELLAEGFARQQLQPLIDRGARMTPALVNRARELGMRRAREQLALENMLGYTGNQRGVSP